MLSVEYFHGVCERCGWETSLGLNAYLAHKCNLGAVGLYRYQRAAAAYPQPRWWLLAS